MAKSNAERKAQTDPRERFKELAQRRTEKALSAIRMIGSIASNGKVEYTAEDVEKIHAALIKGADQMKARMAIIESSDEVFKL